MTRSKYGWALYLSNRFGEAQQVWLSIIEDEPQHGPALTYLGSTCLTAKTVMCLHMTITPELLLCQMIRHSMFLQIQQMRASMYYRLALAAKGSWKKDEAINALEQAIELVPSDANSQFELRKYTHFCKTIF